ncbi:MAG: hypothetical protein WBQ87_01655, partial [Candidatus Sulfotelmatobacter sp.]
MQSGNDNCMRLVLEIGKLFRQQASVMIVNERDRAYDKSSRGDNHGADQTVANQITERFGAVLIALVCYERIKAMNKYSNERHT